MIQHVTNIILTLIVPAVLLLALGADLAILAAWLRGRWR
jgi:hypothetical protein